jgi:hypothetical protein
MVGRGGVAALCHVGQKMLMDLLIDKILYERRFRIVIQLSDRRSY